MENEINVRIKVDLDATPGLQKLLRTIFMQGVPPIQEPLVEAREAETHATDKEPEQQSEQTKPKEQLSEKETSEQEAPKELTEADIREAIHKTRQRIEGMDYKDHPDGEMYKKYHKNLTAAFKNIAALLGADKPSALPADKRATFISECQQLHALDDFGKIGKQNPF